MSSSLRRSASTRDADVEGGAVYDDDIDWTKVKRTPKGKAPPLPLLGAGVCAAWLREQCGADGLRLHWTGDL